MLQQLFDFRILPWCRQSADIMMLCWCWLLLLVFRWWLGNPSTCRQNSGLRKWREKIIRDRRFGGKRYVRNENDVLAGKGWRGARSPSSPTTVHRAYHILITSSFFIHPAMMSTSNTSCAVGKNDESTVASSNNFVGGAARSPIIRHNRHWYRFSEQW